METSEIVHADKQWVSLRRSWESKGLFKESFNTARSSCRDAAEGLLYLELNPEVIVISPKQMLLLEPQNLKALTLLLQLFGLVTNDLEMSDRLRVPSDGQKSLDALTYAGPKLV
jgi:hypothetical protein